MKMKNIALMLTLVVSPLALSPLSAQKGDISVPQDLFYTQDDPLNIREQKTLNFVNAAVAYYQAHPHKEALAVLNDRKGPFCKQAAHGYFGIDVITKYGDVIASCKFPELVGTNKLLWKSPDGTNPMENFLAVAAKNPDGAFSEPYVANVNVFTGEPSSMRSFIRPIDSIVFYGIVYDDTPLDKQTTPM